MAASKTWVLTDVATGTWMDELHLTAKQLGVTGVSVKKRTLHGGLTDGVDVVEICNGPFTFTILPTRGMGFWRGVYKGLPVGWKSPVNGPVHPKFVNLADRGGLGWLAGFDECVVRCGLESNGAPGIDRIPSKQGAPVEVPLGLHGRIANVPAHYVALEVTPGNPAEICLVGVVDEAMLFGQHFRLTTRISTQAGSDMVTMADTITNCKSTPAEMELLYHANFGGPFMEQGSRLLLPHTEVAPRNARAAEDAQTWDRYLGPTAGYEEQCYWLVPKGDAQGNSLALLRNAAGDRGVVTRFNVQELPCFTQWKCGGAQSDGYVTGLEPGTNFPNPRQFERTRQRTIPLAPGGSYTATVAIQVCDSAASVHQCEAEIQAIQGRTRPKVHARPQAKYSP
jgi:hypothetical protein